MTQILRRLCASPALFLLKLAASSKVESLLAHDTHDALRHQTPYLVCIRTYANTGV